MYIDIAVIIIALLVVVFLFRKLSSFVYAYAIIEIFLQLIDFLVVKLELNDVGRIFPSNIPAIYAKYLDGVLLDIALWLHFGIFVCFLVYIVSYFIKKRK